MSGDSKHDRIPMTAAPNTSTTQWGSKGDGSKAKARCSSPLPVNRNMQSGSGSSGGDEKKKGY